MMPPPIPHFHTSRASPAAVEALHPNHTSPPQITTANIIANHNQPHHHQQRNKRNNNTQPRDVLRHRRVVDPHRLVRLRPARGGRRDGVGRRGAGRRGARLQGLVRVRAACLLICLCGGGRVDCNCCVRCPRAATFRRVCTAGRAPLSRQRNTQDDAHHLIRHPPYRPAFHPRSRSKCKEVRCKHFNFRDGYGAFLDRSSVCFDEAASVVVMITDTCPCYYQGAPAFLVLFVCCCRARVC